VQEVGPINRGLSKVISEQGHHDLLMICDAGFSIPKDVEVIDISFKENQPKVIEILNELRKFFSVEKLILAKETKRKNPGYFKEIISVFSDNSEVETIDHKELKELAKQVKAIVRTGDFTAYANVILVSGAGKRWYAERDP
jgi:D-ribose pyranase